MDLARVWLHAPCRAGYSRFALPKIHMAQSAQALPARCSQIIYTAARQALL